MSNEVSIVSDIAIAIRSVNPSSHVVLAMGFFRRSPTLDCSTDLG